MNRSIATLAIAALLASQVATAHAAEPTATKPSVKPYTPTMGWCLNRPKGSHTTNRPAYLAYQYACQRLMIKTLDAIPAGGTFTAATLNADLDASVGAQQDVIGAVIRTHRRGVNVRLITFDGRFKTNPKLRRLVKALGPYRPGRKSYAKVCTGSCHVTGQRNTMHAKYWAASMVVTPQGTMRHVVNVSSYNWTGSTADGSWNHGQTLRNTCLYKALMRYHAAMLPDRTAPGVKPTRCGNHRLWPSPIAGRTDPVLAVLKATSCKTAPTLRVGMFTWSWARRALVAELARLNRCPKADVQVVINSATSDPRITQALVRNRIRTYDGHRVAPRPIYEHSKIMWLTGTMWGRRQARVLQGSHNWTGFAIAPSNELILETLNDPAGVVTLNGWHRDKTQGERVLTPDVAANPPAPTFAERNDLA